MRIIAAVKRRDKGLCQPCLKDGRTTAYAHVDHIKPLHKGGDDSMGNLQAICTECHEAKTYRDSHHGRDKPKPIRAPDW